MSFNFKKTILFILIFLGFLFFLLNAIDLSSHYKNIKIPTIAQSSKIVSNLKDITNKPQVEADDLIKS